MILDLFIIGAEELCVLNVPLGYSSLLYYLQCFSIKTYRLLFGLEFTEARPMSVARSSNLFPALRIALSVFAFPKNAKDADP